MRIETLRFGDNLIHLLLAGARAAVVDPGAAAPVLDALRSLDAVLELILITHHHGDHTGGCRELIRAYGPFVRAAQLDQAGAAHVCRSGGCRIVGPAGGPALLDETVGDAAVITFGESAIEVLTVPGHTAYDVAYYLPELPAVFTGDTLFACGCGRRFGGDAAVMWASLCRLRALPLATQVYGGHDYLHENLQFAVALEPDNAAVRQRLRDFEQGGRDAARDVSTIADECATNPFLRCDTPEVARAVDMPGAPPAAVFAEVRRRKDRW